jgi:hypothetical protein
MLVRRADIECRKTFDILSRNSRASGLQNRRAEFKATVNLS